VVSPSLQELITVLRSCWDAETSFTPEEWTVANPARGQCLVSSLVVQDYFGGDLKRYRVKAEHFEETHYCNILDDGTILDTTGSQYTVAVTLLTTPIELIGYSTARDKMLANDQTRERYELLKNRVTQALREL
jgi:hypothetical protein